MRYKVLRALYNSLPLTKFKPNTLKYRTNCKKLEQLRISMEETLHPEQIAAVDEYTALLDQQCLEEQQQAFFRGVQTGVRFVHEVRSKHMKGGGK